MKKVVLFLQLIVLSMAGFSQTAPVNASAAIRDQATKMGQALIKKDYKTFCHYTYPKLLNMMGGEDKMIAALSQMMDQFRSQGLQVTGMSVGEPAKVVKTSTGLQSTIIQHTEMKLPAEKIVNTTTLIAFSADNGKSWTFMDTNNKDMATVRKMLPELSPAITIPPTQAPVRTKL